MKAADHNQIPVDDVTEKHVDDQQTIAATIAPLSKAAHDYPGGFLLSEITDGKGRRIRVPALPTAHTPDAGPKRWRAATRHSSIVQNTTRGIDHFYRGIAASCINLAYEDIWNMARSELDKFRKREERQSKEKDDLWKPEDEADWYAIAADQWFLGRQGWEGLSFSDCCFVLGVDPEYTYRRLYSKLPSWVTKRLRECLWPIRRRDFFRMPDDLRLWMMTTDFWMSSDDLPDGLFEPHHEALAVVEQKGPPKWLTEHTTSEEINRRVFPNEKTKLAPEAPLPPPRGTSVSKWMRLFDEHKEELTELGLYEQYNQSVFNHAG